MFYSLRNLPHAREQGRRPKSYRRVRVRLTAASWSSAPHWVGWPWAIHKGLNLFLFLFFFFFVEALGFEPSCSSIWLTLPALFCVGSFEIRSHNLSSQGWLWTEILSIAASWVARMIGVSHWRSARTSFPPLLSLLFLLLIHPLHYYY
jgi:hypothetical protein